MIASGSALALPRYGRGGFAFARAPTRGGGGGTFRSDEPSSSVDLVKDFVGRANV